MVIFNSCSGTDMAFYISLMRLFITNPCDSPTAANLSLRCMLSLSLPVYQVRLDWLTLPCIALIQPSQLSCLGSSVGRASAS